MFQKVRSLYSEYACNIVLHTHNKGAQMKRFYGVVLAIVTALLLVVSATPAQASDCNQLFSDWNTAIDNFQSNFQSSQMYQSLADGVTGTDMASNYQRHSYQQSANTYGALSDSWADHAIDIEGEMRRAACI